MKQYESTVKTVLSGHPRGMLQCPTTLSIEQRRIQRIIHLSNNLGLNFFPSLQCGCIQGLSYCLSIHIADRGGRKSSACLDGIRSSIYQSFRNPESCSQRVLQHQRSASQSGMELQTRARLVGIFNLNYFRYS